MRRQLTSVLFIVDFQQIQHIMEQINLVFYLINLGLCFYLTLFKIQNRISGHMRTQSFYCFNGRRKNFLCNFPSVRMEKGSFILGVIITSKKCTLKTRKTHTHRETNTLINQHTPITPPFFSNFVLPSTPCSLFFTLFPRIIVTLPHI